MPIRIPPGPLGTLATHDLRRFVDGVQDVRRDVDRIIDRGVNYCDAFIESYDSASGTYSWIEAYTDKNGQPALSPGGQFGTPAISPAFGVGDGSILKQFPTFVRMYKTTLIAGKGQGWEFPVYCACLQGSGSGGSGSILVACCPTPINRTLFLSITSAACPGCYNGQVVTLTWTPAVGAWQGILVNICVGVGNSNSTIFQLRPCLNPTDGFTLFIESIASGTAGTENCSISVSGTSTKTPICSPFSVTYSATIQAFLGFTCPCAGSAATIIITE